MFVFFAVGGLGFLVYGIATGDTESATFAMACFAMSKAANAMLRTYDLEERDRV